ALGGAGNQPDGGGGAARGELQELVGMRAVDGACGRDGDQEADQQDARRACGADPGPVFTISAHVKVPQPKIPKVPKVPKTIVCRLPVCLPRASSSLPSARCIPAACRRASPSRSPAPSGRSAAPSCTGCRDP